MKKLAALLMAVLFAAALFGCSRTDGGGGTSEPASDVPKPSGAYSFGGENEILRISNGSVVYGERNETFDGGDLEILQPELFADICAYSVRFYTLRGDGQRNEFHVTEATGARDGADSIHGNLGSFSANGFQVINLEQGLWFELKTTDVNGAENTYLLQLTVTEQNAGAGA